MSAKKVVTRRHSISLDDLKNAQEIDMGLAERVDGKDYMRCGSEWAYDGDGNKTSLELWWDEVES